MKGTIHNNISGNNIFWNNITGIKLNYCLNNIIHGNNIQNNNDGILLEEQCGFNNIIGNSISKNNNGISLSFSYDNNIEYNNIEDNEYGLSAIAFGWNNNLIQKNNFIKNKRQATFLSVSNRDDWDSNYWDDWIGVRIKLPFFQRFPKIIYGFFQFDFDWHPAKEPYDIGV